MKIAVMGHGVVGSGVCEVFLKNKDSISRKTGRDIDLKYILELRDFPGLSYSDRFIKSFEIIESDPEIGIVVEVMGGLSPAFDFVERSLKAGKSVVSSNKELVAEKGAYLLELAAQKGVNFFFEASVGGGIPIITPLHQCLAANNINSISGILNGTTNYILTKMVREGVSFESALAEAQALGYAEKDPTADVDGHDACRKICILASLAFGRHVYPKFVHTEGIRKITAEDCAFAGELGYCIKLLGRAKQLEDGRLAVMVSPMLVAGDSQLAGVLDVFNGIVVSGDATGDVMFYGRGAGKLPTASAVVADIIDAAKAQGNVKSLFWKDTGENLVADYLDTKAQVFVRLRSPEDKITAAKLLGIAKELPGKAVMITEEHTEREIAAALKKLGGAVLGAVRVQA